MKYRLCCLY